MSYSRRLKTNTLPKCLQVHGECSSNLELGGDAAIGSVAHNANSQLMSPSTK